MKTLGELSFWQSMTSLLVSFVLQYTRPNEGKERIRKIELCKSMERLPLKSTFEILAFT